jgi:uncharacterized protein
VKYENISADNHIDSRWLPKNLWQDRVASKFKENAPKVVETDKGSVWSWEGRTRGDAADGSSNARLLKHFFGKVQLPAGSLPPSDPKMALQHLDMSKSYAGVYYADTRKWGVQDDALRREIYRVYNDFMMELCSHSPDRLLYLPNLPTFAPDLCLTELKRMIDKGAKAVEFGCYDTAKPIYDKVWDPVFGLAAEAGVPLCCHIGDAAGTPYPPNERGSSFAHFSISPFAMMKYIPQFIFSGAFERFPKLKVSVAECRIGWLPFFISWMDRQIDVRAPDPTAPLSMLPSEYIDRNMTFTFEEDYVGANMIPFDWAKIRNCIIWGSDYPHEQGTWPDPSVAQEKMFAGLDPKLKREILFERSARLFNVGQEAQRAAA